jgi:hypothetical protein
VGIQFIDKCLAGNIAQRIHCARGHVNGEEEEHPVCLGRSDAIKKSKHYTPMTPENQIAPLNDLKHIESRISVFRAETWTPK